MSFCYDILGKDGEDLIKKYGLEEYEVFDLVPARGHDYPIESHHLSSFLDYGERWKESYIIKNVQKRIKENIEKLNAAHCSTCSCSNQNPTTWKLEAAEKFLLIDPDEVSKINRK